MELLADRLQQLGHAELGVENVSHMAARWNLLQKAATDGGFAGADVARQQHKTATGAPAAGTRIPRAKEQMRQRLAVALAHEEVARIRRDRKRVLRQTKMVRVHIAWLAIGRLTCAMTASAPKT